MVIGSTNVPLAQYVNGITFSRTLRRSGNKITQIPRKITWSEKGCTLCFQFASPKYVKLSKTIESNMGNSDRGDGAKLQKRYKVI